MLPIKVLYKVETRCCVKGEVDGVCSFLFFLFGTRILFVTVSFITLETSIIEFWPYI